MSHKEIAAAALPAASAGARPARSALAAAGKQSSRTSRTATGALAAAEAPPASTHIFELLTHRDTENNVLIVFDYSLDIIFRNLNFYFYK